jgi:hypothetical protein
VTVGRRPSGAEGAVLTRVLAYPWMDGPAAPVADAPARVREALAGGAVAVVAYGANASPAVLERKLGAGLARTTPVGDALLHGADVAFSAHVSPHGAVPATLVAHPGVVAEVHVLALPPAALRALDATEPNYTRERLVDAALTLADGAPLATPWVYRSRHGPLRVDGAPVALAAIPARDRTLAALTEAELLDALRLRLDPSLSMEAFVLGQADDPAVRATRTRALRTGDWPHQAPPVRRIPSRRGR